VFVGSVEGPHFVEEELAPPERLRTLLKEADQDRILLDQLGLQMRWRLVRHEQEPLREVLDHCLCALLLRQPVHERPQVFRISLVLLQAVDDVFVLVVASEHLFEGGLLGPLREEDV